VDETSIKVKKVWVYLYRAVDSAGNTLEFLLSPTRDAKAATDFFLKALRSTADRAPQTHSHQEQMAHLATADNATRGVPRVINVDKNAASPKAVADLKAAGALPEHVAWRQVTYLNNLIEQDHRFIQPFPNG
jgi:IS6 family transposase